MDQGLNWELAKALNGLAGHIPLLDTVVALVAQDLIFLMFLSMAVWWFLHLAKDVGKHAAISAMVAIVFGQIINLAIAHTFFVPRPFIAHNVQLLVNAASDSSFPSDHTTAAFGVAITALLWRMPLRWFLLMAAALIAFARVFVGAHYPIDVIASAVLGTMWAGLIFKLNPLLIQPYNLMISVARRVHLA